MIMALGEGEFILSRELDSLSMWDLLSSLPWSLPAGEDLEGEIPLPVGDHLPDYEQLKAAFVGVEKTSEDAFSGTFSEYFRKR